MPVDTVGGIMSGWEKWNDQTMSGFQKTGPNEAKHLVENTCILQHHIDQFQKYQIEQDKKPLG